MDLTASYLAGRSNQAANHRVRTPLTVFDALSHIVVPG